MSDYKVFGSSFEALGRVVGDKLTPAAKDAFRKLGLDYDAPLASEYPYAVFEKALALAGELVFPMNPVDERVYQVGRRMMDSYGETIIGRVLLAMTTVMGPRRTLERAARNLRTANNFTEIRLEWQGPSSCKLHFNRVVFPRLYQGLLERGLELSGGKNVRVTFETPRGEEVTYLAGWGG